MYNEVNCQENNRSVFWVRLYEPVSLSKKRSDMGGSDILLHCEKMLPIFVVYSVSLLLHCIISLLLLRKPTMKE